MSDSRPSSRDAAAPRPHRWRRGVVAGITVLAVAVVVLVADTWRRPVLSWESAGYVGRATCAECHQEQAAAFAGSHHDLAMDRATPETVLGDFSGVEVRHHDVVSRMFRRDGRFWVHTEGPDGKMGDFEVKYVLGVTPLQQYLVEFDRDRSLKPNEVGRLQVLRISWDTKKKQWFYAPPPDVPEKLSPTDPLHWTQTAQRWNTMCADCHTTGFEKGFDVKTLRYHSRFAEIDVSCETCHGPGSAHVAWARARNPLWKLRQGKAIMRLRESSSVTEVETCAPCHSRRGVVDPHWRPQHGYYDHYFNELLEAASYFPDGQIRDEVYVYGSFVQSKMFHKGVRCTDCHDPHSARLKYKGNRVCTSCHQHPEGKYDTPAHHHHREGSPGSRCVECHIPETTYMEVDPRRDHSFRVPRPDLSLTLHTPNACTRCHLDRAELPEAKRQSFQQYRDWVVAAMEGDTDVASALEKVDQWCWDAFQRWYPDWKAPESFADWIVKARRGDTEILPTLIAKAGSRNYPPIVRATLVQEALRLLPPIDPTQPLPSGPASDFFRLCRRLLRHSDPQLRVAAVRAFEQRIPALGAMRVSPQAAEALREQLGPVTRALLPLLEDPKRAVRVEAARVLQRLPVALRPNLLTTPQRELLARVTEELLARYDADADRGGAHRAKALLYENMGREADAIAAYETAIRVDPWETGNRSNLASLLDRLADEEEAAAFRLGRSGQREAGARRMEKAESYRARALQLRKEELPLTERDARFLPDNPEVQYRYGLNLHLAGRSKEAEAPLRRAWELAPENDRYLEALAAYYHQFGPLERARELAEELVRRHPDNAGYRQLLREIQQKLANSPEKERRP